jgi:hypothetical protein
LSAEADDVAEEDLADAVRDSLGPALDRRPQATQRQSSVLGATIVHAQHSAAAVHVDDIPTLPSNTGSPRVNATNQSGRILTTVTQQLPSPQPSEDEAPVIQRGPRQKVQGTAKASYQAEPKIYFPTGQPGTPELTQTRTSKDGGEYLSFVIKRRDKNRERQRFSSFPKHFPQYKYESATPQTARGVRTNSTNMGVSLSKNKTPTRHSSVTTRSELLQRVRKRTPKKRDFKKSALGDASYTVVSYLCSALAWGLTGKQIQRAASRTNFEEFKLTVLINEALQHRKFASLQEASERARLRDIEIQRLANEVCGRLVLRRC